MGQKLTANQLELHSNSLVRPWLIEKMPFECIAWIPFAAGCNIRVTHYILHQGVYVLDIPDERSQYLILNRLERVIL